MIPDEHTHRSRLKTFLLLTTGAVIMAAGVLMLYLWFAMLSPYGYEPPETLLPIDTARDHELFVFGTLRSPVVRWIVMGRGGEEQVAILEGYEKEGLDITPRAGSEVEGDLITVTAEELARLDRYERLGIRYERVKMALADGTSAWVYRRLTR
ncbi:Gamma-glutamyl cyclotransferase, AIG2-like [Marinobacter daqiaonensis]|uniref:Gamma-glutamyl cyclotransferase, AIG2-like n=1 Tax=Marinobacter daqiaonensis TaxID=650891 RepID=A0A1I6I677_9GAMM|nr:gamma-glutamylcyclotransferase family protein [Marinobacter daqiaonensis]SFR62212.1 Gamma-glutamyl cyclotransferase, AIG2-like [Marinobacter daqiaonensis]